VSETPTGVGEPSDTAVAQEVLGAGSVISAESAADELGDGLVIVEDSTETTPGATPAGSSAVLMVWYREEMIAPDVLDAARRFGDGLKGVVLNNVPKLRMHAAISELVPEIESGGARVLGVVPQDRLLLAPTVGELAEFLDAEVIAFPEGLEEPAENLMMGALALDGGIHYYGDTDRKVVITRWDRPDLQMPAMATGCQGLILTNGGRPIPYVWDRVQELKIPVALVQSGTVATANKLGNGFLAGRGAASRRKVDHLADALAEVAPGLVGLIPA
jgi:BioD-like phosphotransacetylase family protein